MDAMIWIGAGMAVVGLAGLAWCIRRAMEMKKSPLPPEEAQGVFHRLIAVNMASVAFAFLGLGLLIVGLIL